MKDIDELKELADSMKKHNKEHLEELTRANRDIIENFEKERLDVSDDVDTCLVGLQNTMLLTQINSEDIERFKTQICILENNCKDLNDGLNDIFRLLKE